MKIYPYGNAEINYIERWKTLSKVYTINHDKALQLDSEKCVKLTVRVPHTVISKNYANALYSTYIIQKIADEQ